MELLKKRKAQVRCALCNKKVPKKQTELTLYKTTLMGDCCKSFVNIIKDKNNE